MISPFLPDGRQWAWNSSSLSPAKECARKYYYEVIEGWRRKADNVHLAFGGHYAKALETYHKNRAAGMSHDDAEHHVVAAALSATAEWPFEHNTKTRDNLIRSIVWYLENFRNDPCKTVHLSDGTPAVELSFQFKVTDDITLCGHLDRLVEYAGSTWIQDQKTTGSTLSPYYFKRFNPDNQMSLYSYAAKVVWATPVAGVMIDAAQIAVGFTRFERGFTHRTEAQLEEWLADTIYHIKIIWGAADAGWPMNDKACQLYGGCPFIDICSKDPRVREDFLRTNFEKVEVNPLR